MAQADMATLQLAPFYVYNKDFHSVLSVQVNKAHF